MVNIFQCLNDHYSQIIIAALAMISAIIAFVSYYSEKKRKRIDKAIQLAQFYQKKIVNASTKIIIELSDSKFDNISAVAFGKIRNADFTLSEAEKLLKDNAKTNLEEYEKMFQLVEPAKVFSAGITVNCWNVSIKYLHDSYVEAVNSKDKEQITQTTKSCAVMVEHDIVELLNTLEWFSMYFVNHIADEDTAYQSIHQTYLGIVRQLYFFISRNNNDAYNKYYTNIIELYNKWQTKSDNRREKEAKINNKLKKQKNKIFQTKHKYH